MSVEYTQDGFPEQAPCAGPLFFRTYSRRKAEYRESFEEVNERTVNAIAKLGKWSEQDKLTLLDLQRRLMISTSGRWLWLGGTEWLEKPQNHMGAFNCTSLTPTDFTQLGYNFALLMQGCGVGLVLLDSNVKLFPPIIQDFPIEILEEAGTIPTVEETHLSHEGDEYTITVGDTREGWVKAYTDLLDLYATTFVHYGGEVYRVTKVTIDMRGIRPAGTPIKGFGGVANPEGLPGLFKAVSRICRDAYKRGGRLTTVDVALLGSEAAKATCAGNIRRSAMMIQFSAQDELGKVAKKDLWQKNPDGSWGIDPTRDAFRMGNHTHIYFQPPTLEECIESVRSQFYSGEGAIQWAGETVARANRDLLGDGELKQQFIQAFSRSEIEAAKILAQEIDSTKGGGDSIREGLHRLARLGLNPCAEVIGQWFTCNLSQIHLEIANPRDLRELDEALRISSLVVASLLHLDLPYPEFQTSKQQDPIVQVTFTGLFDFLVNAFGDTWLQWWMDGSPLPSTKSTWRLYQGEWTDLPWLTEAFPQGIPEAIESIFIGAEKYLLRRWKGIVEDTVTTYCKEHGLKVPNRMTGVQPSGSKSLMTGGAPGWHPPKAPYYIRRITFKRSDPVAQACRAYGYNVIPSQACKDESGRLLTDPDDNRVHEWLVEIPCQCPWVTQVEKAYDVEQAPVHSQWRLFMSVQEHYSTHNTSATIEFYEGEIQELASYIYEAIRDGKPYLSAALLARDNEVFPTLPFGKVSRDEYLQAQEGVLARRQYQSFQEALRVFDTPTTPIEEGGKGGCEGLRCTL